MTRTGFARPLGLSLLETLIAFFLLTVASLLIVVLFHSGLQRSRAVYDQTQARIIARDVMDSVRAEAADGGFQKESDLSLFRRSYQHPEFQQFQVDVEAELAEVFSPSSGDEAEFTPDQQRSLKSSTAKIQVRVSWNNASQSVVMLTLIAEAPRTLAQVKLAGSGPISSGASSELTAEALDSGGVEIEDLKFVWWVEPITASGTIVPARHSRTARLINTTRSKDGVTKSTVGLCRVAAMAAYQGQEVIGYSSDIVMAP